MEPFGVIGDETVSAVTLVCGGMSCRIIDYGCTLVSLTVPDRNGKSVDVVLGYDDIDSYASLSGRLGATMGRCINRIGDASFVLNGKEHRLSANRGQDHIHGGFRGFDKRIWHIKSESERSVTMSLRSKDGDEGYPGALDVRVTYSLNDGGLSIRYEAECDSDTICNLSNHSYFNLGGSGTVEDHFVTIGASRFTPSNERGIPTGEIRDVSGSNDFRRGKLLSDVLGDGFDINYLLDAEGLCASCSCGRTGILMTVSTDMPAMQFFTGNGLKDGTRGKNGTSFGCFGGLCFETQHCPDAPNHPEFPSSVLRKGDVYDHTTSFEFDII